MQKTKKEQRLDCRVEEVRARRHKRRQCPCTSWNGLLVIIDCEIENQKCLFNCNVVVSLFLLEMKVTVFRFLGKLLREYFKPSPNFVCVNVAGILHFPGLQLLD